MPSAVRYCDGSIASWSLRVAQIGAPTARNPWSGDRDVATPTQLAPQPLRNPLKYMMKSCPERSVVRKTLGAQRSWRPLGDRPTQFGMAGIEFPELE